MKPDYALHESLELSEVTAFKVVCLTKAKTMQMLVTDPELKRLMQLDVEVSTRQLQELDAHLTHLTDQGVNA